MNKNFRFAGAVLAMCLSAQSMAQSSTSLPPAVQVSQIAIDDAGHPSIPIVIWSPPSGKKLGLIVVSHGTGAGPAAHIDTAQALASSGFVVVAPMHPGDNFQDDSSVGKPQWFADRARHVSKVLDYMLNDWTGRSRLDPNRVGIFGMSAGATTALLLAGGELDLVRTSAHCRTQPEFVCQIMAPTDQSQAPVKGVRDRRIRAQVLAAPGLGFGFSPGSLRQISEPTQIWAGAADQTVPGPTNSGLIYNLIGKAAELHTVDNAVHLSFLAPCDPDSPPIICKDNPGFDRKAFHDDFNRKVVEFFRSKLR